MVKLQIENAPAWIYLLPLWITAIVCGTIIIIKWKPWENK